MKSNEVTSPGSRLRAARKAAGMSAAELGVQAAALAGRSKPISESAIRNQENGTNGIPMMLLGPYSKILNVDPSYILLGDIPHHEGQVDEDLVRKAEYAAERYFVGMAGMASARWTETTSTGSNDLLGLHIEIPDFSPEHLSILEVSDNTLEPTFAKGSYLITAPPDHCPIYEGAIVVLFTVRDGIFLECVRKVRTEGGKIEFVSVTGHDKKVIAANDTPPFYVDRVVVGAITLFEPKARMPLLLPKHLQAEPEDADESLLET